MTDSETKKAAYRWVAEAIRCSWLTAELLPGPDVFAEVERIREAMAAAGAIEVAKGGEKGQPVAAEVLDADAT